MKRIDLMQREEIMKFLTSAYEGDCVGCPLEGICRKLKGRDCKETALNYLFDEAEMVQRASLYKKGEEACEEFFGNAFHDHKYGEPDIVDFAEFLMEKVPKPLDKKPKM